MGINRFTENQISRLADDVRAKILSQKNLIANSRGKIEIEAYPKGDGFDIILTIKT